MGLNLLRFLVVEELRNMPTLARGVMCCWYSRIFAPSTFLFGSPFLFISLFLSYIYSALFAISIITCYKRYTYIRRIRSIDYQ